LLTRGTQAVSGREKVEPASASLWGFGRTLAAEHPGLWGGLLDLPLRKAAAPTEDGRAIHVALGRTDDEDQVAVRGELRYGARLRRVPSDARGVPAALSAGATYLITGGLGTIGLGIAERLVAQGARSLVLSGRSGAKEAAREVIAGLEARGATVRVVQADVADESDMRALFESLRGGLPLRGVVHCAGVLDDGTVAQLPWHKFESVLASKSRGAWLLHRFTRRLRLDFFIVQSSILSQIGSPGQANYTAANAFLDSLVAYRRALGLPATAINWGAWAEHGMAASAGARGEAMWRARGMRFIPLDAGFAMFDELMARQLGDVTVTIMDWAAFVKNRGARPALCRDLVEEPVTIATPQPATRQTEPLPRPTSAAPGALQTGRAWLIDFLGKEIAERLGVEGALDPQQPLDELGLDSLMSVTLANRIEQALGVTVPIGTLIRGVSIAQVADKLLPRVTIPAGQLSAATPPAFEAPAIEWSSEPDGPDVPAQSSTTCVASPELAPPIQLRDAPAREVPAPRDVPQTPRSARDVRATRVSRDRWLVFPRPNPAAKARLFCFPFAGGGAAPYRPWLDRLDPAIELVAIEPPGHGGRIKERPLTTVEPYLKAVTRAMSSSYLDKPCALFGACLGGLIAYEVARRLLMSGLGDPVHFFVAGARPPHRVGDFTPFEEELLKYTLALPEYDFDRPAYEQPDVVMGEYIRRFNMDAANEMLTHRELRKLLMPAIRADFAITARYSPTPIATWPLAITAFHGLADPYVSREQALEWSRYTGRSFKLAMRPGAHDMMVHEQAFVIDSINQELR
jgi:surfactin synthase thioesterase subunit/NAD(P)-dependent dehydrogenase (short-subunit alcohol dehydrogenase family)/acyl carrier protein